MQREAAWGFWASPQMHTFVTTTRLERWVHLISDVPFEADFSTMSVELHKGPLQRIARKCYMWAFSEFPTETSQSYLRGLCSSLWSDFRQRWQFLEWTLQTESTFWSQTRQALRLSTLSCKPPSPSAEVELDFTFKWQKQLCDQTMKEEKTWSKFVEGSLQNGWEVTSDRARANCRCAARQRGKLEGSKKELGGDQVHQTRKDSMTGQSPPSTHSFWAWLDNIPKR